MHGIPKVQRIETNIYKNTAEGFDAAFNELDINSVIDQMLVLELAMNREYGDPRSVYMFMDKDGKLSGGPVWDFDRGTFQYYDGAKSLGNSDRLKEYDEWDEETSPRKSPLTRNFLSISSAIT